MRTALLFVALLVSCGGGGGGGAGTPTVDASSLPLLAIGSRIGVFYSQATPAARATLDAAFAEVVANGVDSHEISIPWTDIESAPGVVDTTAIAEQLASARASGLVPYLLVRTIDVNNLNVPADLVGLDFDDPKMLARFATVIDAVVPLLVQEGGFYLSVGNEVDSWLAANPAQINRFASFVSAARERAHAIEPRLAVGVTVQFGVLTKLPAAFAALKDASDVLSFTYYPIKGDFGVRDPADVFADIQAMLDAIAPAPLLLQEVGYPAGSEPTPSNGSSPEMQRQFVANMFAVIAANPRIRFASFWHLADWSVADLDFLEAYFGLSDPAFREFLGSLGMRSAADGAAKPAYAEFLARLAELRGG